MADYELTTSGRHRTLRGDRLPTTLPPAPTPTPTAPREDGPSQAGWRGIYNPIVQMGLDGTRTWNQPETRPGFEHYMNICSWEEHASVVRRLGIPNDRLQNEFGPGILGNREQCMDAVQAYHNRYVVPMAYQTVSNNLGSMSPYAMNARHRGFQYNSVCSSGGFGPMLDTVNQQFNHVAAFNDAMMGPAGPGVPTVSSFVTGFTSPRLNDEIRAAQASVWGTVLYRLTQPSKIGPGETEIGAMRSNPTFAYTGHVREPGHIPTQTEIEHRQIGTVSSQLGRINGISSRVNGMNIEVEVTGGALGQPAHRTAQRNRFTLTRQQDGKFKVTQTLNGESVDHGTFSDAEVIEIFTDLPKISTGGSSNSTALANNPRLYFDTYKQMQALRSGLEENMRSRVTMSDGGWITVTPPGGNAADKWYIGHSPASTTAGREVPAGYYLYRGNSWHQNGAGRYISYDLSNDATRTALRNIITTPPASPALNGALEGAGTAR